MFWIGLVISVIGGLVSVPFVRDWIQLITRRKIEQRLFDSIRVTLIISGAIIAAVVYVRSQHGVTILRDYGYVAMLNRLGSKGPVRDKMLDFGDLFLTFQDVFSVDNNKVRLFSCDVRTMKKIDNVIEVAQKFPFSYYAKAGCLQKSGDESWRSEAQKAIAILEITTTIPGHHSDHDAVLHELSGQLLNPTGFLDCCSSRNR